MFVQPKFESDDITRKDCESIVGSLGKFESSPAYLPYIWNRIGVWGEYPDSDLSESALKDYCESIGEDYLTYIRDDDGSLYDGLIFWNRYRYDITLQDIANFPELNGVGFVAVWESESGFVYCQEYPTESKTIQLGADESESLSEWYKLAYPTIGVWSDQYEIPSGLDFMLITDPDQAEQVLSDLGYTGDDIDSMFVAIADGDYTEVWGFSGEIPYTHKSIYKLL